MITTVCHLDRRERSYEITVLSRHKIPSPSGPEFLAALEITMDLHRVPKLDRLLGPAEEKQLLYNLGTR